jgi:hypothetical protein
MCANTHESHCVGQFMAENSAHAKEQAEKRMMTRAYVGKGEFHYWVINHKDSTEEAE